MIFEIVRYDKKTYKQHHTGIESGLIQSVWRIAAGFNIEDDGRYAYMIQAWRIT